jgi:hypothetical protein
MFDVQQPRQADHLRLAVEVTEAASGAGGGAELERGYRLKLAL